MNDRTKKIEAHRERARLDAYVRANWQSPVVNADGSVSKAVTK